MKKDYATRYLNKIVNIVIDRPLGTKHPKFNLRYPINYGFIKNTKAPDNENIDAYILGIDKPLEKFKGKCIAVIHRLDDDDDKLIVVPKNISFTNIEISNAVKFQEKYFKSIIIK